MTVFVDTGARYARHVPSDPNHGRVKAWFDSNEQRLLTTDYCLDETVTLLVARGKVRRTIELGRSLLEERLAQLYFITPAQVRRAWILFETRGPTGWSFTDCTSRIVMDDLRIRTGRSTG